MTHKRKPRTVGRQELWPPCTTEGEVIQFIARRYPEFMLGFSTAYRERHNLHMIENVKLLRGLVTRLDQFRRMKVRQWAKDEKLKLNQEKPNP